jgi:Porin subfamily
MTLIKSLLLGSAAGIVAVASAQAADLPTRKGAPAAEYVKICTINVGGKPVVGFTLPGSDTCLKLSGYITAQIEGGNLQNGYSTSYIPAIAGFAGQTNSGTSARPSFGYTTRLNFAADVVSNTSAGPLAGHLEMQYENGNGFDTTGVGAYINLAYVTWAGITAGKAASFFSFTGGGAGWANFFSPDQKGFNQPDVLAYTASFGGGFAATIAIQSPGANSYSADGLTNAGQSGGGTNYSDLGANYTYNGMRWPDVVAALSITQGWGKAQISGVAHNVDVTAYNGATQNTAGWGVDAGVSFNLPTFGAGDQILLTGAYTENAAWYSGLPDAMWGENGAVNGNGQQMALADTYYNGTGFQKPSMWSVTAEFDHTFTPEITGSIEASYGGVQWGSGTDVSVVSNAQSWLVGAVGHYDPVKNLDFELEVLYQGTNNTTPNLYATTNTPWHGNADGVAARFEITRSW